MKKTLLTILGFVMMPLVAVAQPDFSGSWVPNVGLSEPAENELYMYGRLDNDPVRQPDLMIEQEGDTVEVYEDSRVLTRYAIPALYVADGLERTVTVENTGLTEQQMTSAWVDNKLVIDIVKPWGGMPGNVMLNTREEWMLSPDGSKLYITTQHNSPAKNIAYTVVYDRQ